MMDMSSCVWKGEGGTAEDQTRGGNFAEGIFEGLSFVRGAFASKFQPFLCGAVGRLRLAAIVSDRQPINITATLPACLNPVHESA